MRLQPYRLFALFAVLVGVSLVGVSPIFIPDDDQDDLIVDDDQSEEDERKLNAGVGILLILAAQVVLALQFVIEEKIMNRFTVQPVKMVGLEGFFGMFTILAVMAVVYPIAGRGTGSIIDIGVGAEQILANDIILYSTIAASVAIGAFNYFGMTITRHVSATSRSTIDSTRTLFIWMISLAIGWEQFKWLQVIGFLVLLYGTFLFNRVIPAYPSKAFLKRIFRKRMT